MRGGYRLQQLVVHDHRPVCPVRQPGCPLLRRQYLQQWLLLQWQLYGRGHDMHQRQLRLQLRSVQIWPLHLREFRCAVLPDQHLPDQHRLRNL